MIIQARPCRKVEKVKRTHRRRKQLNLSRINMPLDKWAKPGKENSQKGIYSNKANI